MLVAPKSRGGGGIQMQYRSKEGRELRFKRANKNSDKTVQTQKGKSSNFYHSMTIHQSLFVFSSILQVYFIPPIDKKYFFIIHALSEIRI